MLEVEVKIKINQDGIEKKLIERGFCKRSCVYEYDRYFNCPIYDLKTADKALRIREYRGMDSDQARYVLNFKGSKIDDITMTREETQFEIPSLQAGLTILNGLGYYISGNVEKTRVHYKKDDMVCCLDRVTGLGEFLEIEILAEKEDYDSAVKRIEDMLKALGLDMGETLRESYLSMLEAD